MISLPTWVSALLRGQIFWSSLGQPRKLQRYLTIGDVRQTRTVHHQHALPDGKEISVTFPGRKRRYENLHKFVSQRHSINSRPTLIANSTQGDTLLKKIAITVNTWMDERYIHVSKILYVSMHIVEARDYM